jgi:hypothetical protein
MNTRKLAEAIRLLAPVVMAVADAVDDDGSEALPRVPAPQQRPRGPRVPLGIEVTETDRQAAKKAAAGKGILGSQ